MPGGSGRGKGPWWRRLMVRGESRMNGRGRPDFCICPTCGYVTAKEPGSPCFITPCPACGARMARRFDSGE